MFKSLLKITQPIILFLAALAYILGASIAHYLGCPFRTASFGLGLLAVLALLGGAFILVEYFRMPLMPLTQDETPRQRERFHIFLLQVSYAALSLFAVAVLTLLLTHSLNPTDELLLLIVFLLIVAYAVPPLRISKTGYGELVLAITLGSLLPALAFLLQYGQFHRLLSFVTFPITLLALAYLMICNFPSFATDLKMERHTLLTRLTWQWAVPIHQLLVLIAFLFYAIAPFLQYPWSLIWPVFLASPFAAIQMIMLQRIANGGRTFWNLLSAIAGATFGLTVYLLALTFWIR